jgi:hypothetical protein
MEAQNMTAEEGHALTPGEYIRYQDLNNSGHKCADR